uniref:KaiB domain protein n=1 Tax=Cyanothece sp. (strain PCC 7425 / ATCC 29141) TaxID=395961 RepID=B8HPQ3_CYAP4
MVYCLDPTKRGRWHHHLCAALQELLNLPEIPLFLTPCYTATLDTWFDPQTQQFRIAAEAYPLVLRHQAVLNAIFAIDHLVWQSVSCPEGLCDPLVLNSYRQQFPQLWQHHNLVVRLDSLNSPATLAPNPALSSAAEMAELPPERDMQGYVLRLFVAGHSTATEQILKNLHLLLTRHLKRPYTLRVIDVTKQPEQAEQDQVSATPTLVKAWPHPVRRLVGDLNNLERLGRMLNHLESEE